MAPCDVAAVWAEAAAALRLRRAELLAKTQQPGPDAAAGAVATAPASSSVPSSIQPQPQGAASEHASTANGMRSSKVASSVATPSVVRPRGGVRQGALGPFLARLRTETES